MSNDFRQFDSTSHGAARGTLPRMSEPHLSPQAYERLREELEERTTTRRREISLWIERAREHGDIKENADYDAAKNEQGHNEARVRQLEAMLEDAVVIEGASAGEVVEPGVLVELRHDGDDDADHLPRRLDRGTPRHLRRALDRVTARSGAPRRRARRDRSRYQGPKRELGVDRASRSGR